MPSFAKHHIIMLHGCKVARYCQFAKTNGEHDQMDFVLLTGNECVANGY
jgi:hypothetical protein